MALKKFYKSFSLLLALLMVISACICPAVVSADETTVSNPANVAYVKTSNSGPMGQIVPVEAGETYVLTFSLSNAITPTVGVNDQNVRYKTIENVTSTQISAEVREGKYTVYTYEVTMPETLSVTHAIVGIKFGGTKTGYLFNASLYKKSDAAKTEMYTNGDFSEGNFDGWVFKYFTFSENKGTNNLSSATFSAEDSALNENGETYLEIVPFEEAPLKHIDYALHFTVTDKGPIQQRYNSFEIGENYTFTFSLSNTVEQSNLIVGAYDKDSRTTLRQEATLVSAEDMGYYTVYTYSLPSIATDSNTQAFVGMRFKAACEGYLFNTSLYKTSDANKTELFKFPSFNDGFLDMWTWGYTDFRSGAKLGLTEYEINTTTKLEVVELPKSLIGPDTTTPKMLYVNSGDAGPLAQQVRVEGGATYIYSFAVSNNLECSVAVNDNDQRHAPTKDVEIYQMSSENKGKFTVYTYGITMPDKILSTKTGLETNIVIIGTKFKAGSEGYFTNASLYKFGDEAKTELLRNNDFKGSYLDYWIWQYKNYTSGSNLGKKEDTFTSNEKTVTLKVMKLDESKMVGNPQKTMFYVEDPDNGTDEYEKLVLKTQTLKPNVEYTISFDYKFIRSKWCDSVCFALFNSNADSGQQKSIIYDNRADAGKTFASVSDDGVRAVYKFTLTTEQAESKSNFYVGIQFLPTALKTQLYIADLTLYETADVTKTNLCLSDEYATTVENWFANWAGSSDATKQIFYRSKGSNENSSTNLVAQYLPYDASLFKSPTDIHYGDVDLDGSLDLLDLVCVDEAITKGSAYSVNADANASGAVEKTDLNTIKRHLIGMNALKWVKNGHGLMESANLSGGADSEAAALKNQIANASDTLKKGSSSNKIYYVAQNGKYSNNGTSQSTPITVDKLSLLSLKSGDLVLFKRGDTFRLSNYITPVDGVGYGAYGTGAKPKLFGSIKNYADESLWTTTDNKLWKVKVGVEEATQVVFNNGEFVGSRKPSLETVKFNGDFYYDTSSKYLYLYFNQVNPAKRFDSIEIATTEMAFRYIRSDDTLVNTKFENLDMRYFIFGAFNLYFTDGVSINNCEMGWLGGLYNGSGNRYGNAIQLWRYSKNTDVSNNYIYQTFDAAITFQGHDNNEYENLTFKNNLMEYCSMNFEFWGSKNYDEYPNATINNIKFEDNIIRFGGYGFAGEQRETQLNQAMILAWNNSYVDGMIKNFTIKNNILDTANCNFYYGTETFVDVEISGNTYYQKAGSIHPVIKGNKTFGDDLASFEAQIKLVDSTPKKVAWVN